MDPGYVATHVAEDQHHWWFRGRRAALVSVLRTVLPRRRLKLVEIGCGSGSLLPAAAEFGDVLGVDASEGFLAAARQRGFTVLAGALPDQLPLPAGVFDGVFLFDVLEHLEDDRAALSAAGRILKPGGVLVCTVPAYQWLWSAHDEALGHRRRYTVGGLMQIARDVGLQPLRMTYFNTLLALPIVGIRLLKRWRGRAGHDLRRPSAPLNALLAWVFSLEAGLLRCANLPFGVSVLLIARRPAH